MDAVTNAILSQQSQDIFFTLRTDGDDKSELVVRSFKVNEGLSKLFTVELELASRRSDIDLTKLIDKPACLTINDRYGKPRHFHGLVERAQKGATGRPNERGLTWTFYRLTLMPAAHRLRYCSDLRIFMQQSVPEIIETVLRENGVQDFRFVQTEKHPIREYLTQYRENTWDFVERLLAEEGFYFTHEFTDKKHTLVMSDRSVVAPDCAEAATVEYNANPGGDVKGNWIRDFSWTEVVRTSLVNFNEYTFKSPYGSLLEGYRVQNDNGLNGTLEHYDYPGGYKANDVGKDYARYELEARRSDASHGSGSGYCQHFRAGSCFDLKEHDDKALNKKYLLTNVYHEGTQPQALEEAAGEDGGTFYETRFEVIDANTPWRAPRRRKPMAATEIATVTGPSGEEIYTDEFSRIRVKFPWDRSGKTDDTTSCWIRVAQAWGGGNYGNVAIPRIGHEVIVGFLGHDPDQPIILGRTYHAANHTPYQLPHNKTKMAIRSDTHKGSGYNELSFEDQSGEQNFFMHAEKDHTVKVKNNQSSRVDANAVHSIGDNHSLEVGTNMSHQVGGGMNQVIGAVGGGVAGLLTGVLQNLMGQSGSMLGAAMGMISQAAQAAPSQGGGSETAESAAGQALPALASTAGAVMGGGEGGHGGKSEGSGGSLGDVAGQAASLASSALGGGDGGGALDALRGALNGASAFSLATQGGSGMASAAASLGSTLAGAVGGGVLNQLIGQVHNSAVGLAKTENVGAVKVSNIGQMFLEKVGSEKKVRIGDRFTVEVGPEKDKDGNEIPPKAVFIMDKEGNIVLQGAHIYIVGEAHVQLLSAMIDNN